ncbi:protein PYRICULARIA ORYZAE RESISTANCE 21 isoform X2 [Juglans microcarpa x Juglans regia]|uniref:protein PYRICULARIA ORYZAE RESISTANCE 21 isoform X2 n=1 Tax=Juglans microcarpa x Juglans regia TaxID=2249226 RepID=UPI001B7E76E4|nr:protein PYRICULARIA ORYZAE RESISTANCE 21 isoform X2 [Juglans microcarpa x Juglans regia]
MVEKATTIMVLEVDLQCHRCYKKVKKVLCKIPQIQDQVYDEKKNLVMIKVVCCSPEKIKQKIICKGGDSIKSIEIKQPPKPKEPEKPKAKAKDPPKPAEKPKESEKPKEKPANPPKPAEKPKEPEKPKEKAADPPKPAEKPKEPAPAPAPKPPVVVPCYPVLPAGNPIGTCCSSCYEGRGGGPCFHGHGGPPPSYEGYGRPVYDSYGGGYYRPACYVSRCDYFNEENTSGCTIM